MSIEISSSNRIRSFSGAAAAASAQPAERNFGDVLRSVSGRGRNLDPIFAQASETYGVPSPLLRAIAFHESGFQTDAVSSAGAMGLMQLMPATVETMGVEDPFDARQNVMGGAKLLRRYLDQYDGDLKLTLAAYGAGSGAVAKYGGVPPYEETRGFVRDILSAVDPQELGDLTSWSAAPSLREQAMSFDDFTSGDYERLLLLLHALGGFTSLSAEEDPNETFLPSSYFWLR